MKYLIPTLIIFLASCSNDPLVSEETKVEAELIKKTETKIVGYLNAQYPFEKYPSIKYLKKGTWIVQESKTTKTQWTSTASDFFNPLDSLTVQLSAFEDKDSSLITIFKNQKQIQLLMEPYSIGGGFGSLYDTLLFADFNADSLLDVKILWSDGGCGIAGLNERVIYLIQQPENKFTKFSFLDMASSMRLERDLNGDGNFEIITMTLNGYESHNYWTFNLYNFTNDDLICVNDKFDYPIMIQFLFKKNYKVTDKITKKKMKTFSMEKPEFYDKK